MQTRLNAKHERNENARMAFKVVRENYSRVQKSSLALYICL